MAQRVRHGVARQARRWGAGWLLCCCAATVTAAGREDEFFVVANTQFTVLHEVGHVMLTEVDLPFLGGEEQASDQLAAVALLLSTGPGRDPRATDKLVVAAQGWLIEWALQQGGGGKFDYWDSHPLDIQRYYNLLCLLHGGGTPAAGAALRGQLPLPYQRAWRCDDEYARVLRSLKWISQTHGAAAQARRLAPAKVGVIYEPPATVERAALQRLLRRSGVLEQAARIIETHFALPRDINIVLANICGETAYWREDLQEIIVCYALVERFTRLARYRPCLTPRQGKMPARPPEEEEVALCMAERVRRLGLP